MGFLEQEGCYYIKGGYQDQTAPFQILCEWIINITIYMPALSLQLVAYTSACAAWMDKGISDTNSTGHSPDQQYTYMPHQTTPGHVCLMNHQIRPCKPDG